MKAYIDIDGVLLTKKQTIPEDGPEFIQFLVSIFDCYWLTTHCRQGENKTIPYLSQFYSDSVIEQLKSIRPTNWVDLKTEAIDFGSNFIWLEDAPFQAEMRVLEQNNIINQLIIVDLNNRNELLRIKEELINMTNLDRY